MNVNSWLKKRSDLRLDAELILLEVLGEKDKSFLVAHGDMELDALQERRADEMWRRRVNGEPLAYILGHKEFYGRDFRVDARVLIPRPETEEAIEAVRNLRKDEKVGRVLDVGTGSGCIAVTLALEFPEIEASAVDISTDVLELAQMNAMELGANVKFCHSDLLDGCSEDYDVIVANLPYVDKNWGWLSPELKGEPDLALYAEDGGLELIFKLLKQAMGRCRFLVLEYDPCQHEAVKKYAANLGWRHIESRGFILTYIRSE